MVARSPRKKAEVLVTEAPTEAVTEAVKVLKKDTQAKVKIDKYHLRAEAIKILLNARAIISACVVNNIYDDSSKYMITFEAHGYDDSIKLMHSRDSRIRSFASLDKAVDAIQEIGIKGEIKVCVSARY